MTAQNKFIGAALIASAVALAVGVFAWIRIMTPDDDQPVTMVGGSLRMDYTERWTYNSGLKLHTYRTKLPVEKVHWWCKENQDDPTTAAPNGAVTITLMYSAIGETPHEIEFKTDRSGTLTAQSKSGGPGHHGFLTRLIHAGEHPNKQWTVLNSHGSI